MIAPPKPAPHDELEALIKEARERQLRRRLLSTAGVAIAAALGLSVHAFVIGGSANSGTPTNAGPASAPLCRSSQISATANFQGATQSMLGGVGITNTGGAACSLPQRRPLVSISWRGKRLLTKERRMTTGPPWPDARALAPGATANVFFQWWSCDGPGPRAAVRPTFTLRFGYGLLVTARSKDVTPAYCGGLSGTRFLDVSRPLVNR